MFENSGDFDAISSPPLLPFRRLRGPSASARLNDPFSHCTDPLLRPAVVAILARLVASFGCFFVVFYISVDSFGARSQSWAFCERSPLRMQAEVERADSYKI